MSKGELIAAIRQLNRSVSEEFLQRFGEGDLRAYLDRIVAVLSVPERPTDTSGLHATVDARQDLMIA
jgi:hypothetical protein